MSEETNTYRGFWAIADPSKKDDDKGNGYCTDTFVELVEVLWSCILDPKEKWDGEKRVRFFPYVVVDCIDDMSSLGLSDSCSQSRKRRYGKDLDGIYYWMECLEESYGDDLDKPEHFEEALAFAKKNVCECFVDGEKKTFEDAVRFLWDARPEKKEMIFSPIIEIISQ